MTKSELDGLRRMAETVADGGRYTLYDGKGRVVMFDITKARADEYLRYYPGGRVEKSK
jgi:hypothetical protein